MTVGFGFPIFRVSEKILVYRDSIGYNLKNIRLYPVHTGAFGSPLVLGFLCGRTVIASPRGRRGGWPSTRLPFGAGAVIPGR
jgi:hypothetical protein